MSKTDSENRSFSGNLIYDHLLQRPPHLLSGLSRALDFSFFPASLKDFYIEWSRGHWAPVLYLN